MAPKKTAPKKTVTKKTATKKTTKPAPRKSAAKKALPKKAVPAARKRPAAAAKKAAPQEFKITYSTLGNIPEREHTRFSEAVEEVKRDMGKDLPMLIGREERGGDAYFEDTSPIDARWTLARFPKGTRQDGKDALGAARKAAHDWGRMPWQERVALLRKSASLIEKRLHYLSAALALEVGKNRLEAWGDVQETADLIYYYCDQMEVNNGYDKPMLSEDPKGDPRRNRSILKPYGVWVVIAPFNFPFALAGGPAGAALVAGNTVVFKPATDTSLTGYLLSRAFLDAGLPEGVFNFVTGPGSTIGDELVTNPEVDGITFTGSYGVGMHILKTFTSGRWPRPCIAEMGGKNPTIVTRNADLELAAHGVMRSAFGLQGQKCSACSRIFVDRAVKAEFTDLLLKKTAEITIGDPTRQENWLGPVINDKGYAQYAGYVAKLGEDGDIIAGGRQLKDGDLAHGYFCAPTIVDNLPYEHALWQEEMFLPITTLGAYDSLEEAMRLANGIEYGLTAGVYSRDNKEVEWFFANSEAGVTYANRRTGATTGAWPGYQAFGGWKGSGSTGKAAGSLYYVPQYMHEQSQTWVHNPK